MGLLGFMWAGEFTCPSWKAYHPSMLSLSDVVIDSRSNPSVVFVSLRQIKTDVFRSGFTLHLSVPGLLCVLCQHYWHT